MVPLPGSPKFLGDIPADEREKLRRRMRDLPTRLFNEGKGPFLLGMLFLTLAGISLRVLLLHTREYERKVHSEIVAAIGSKHEPTSVNKNLGLIASVLAPINNQFQIEKWPCSQDQIDCDAISSFHSIFSKMTAYVYSPSPSEFGLEKEKMFLNDCVMDVAPEPPNFLDGAPLGSKLKQHEQIEWLRVAKAAAKKVWCSIRLSTKAKIQRPGFLSTPSERLKYLGPPVTTPQNAITLTTLLVPSQQQIPAKYKEWKEGADECWDAECEEFLYPQRIHRAIHLSDLLDSTMRLIEKPTIASLDRRSEEKQRDNAGHDLPRFVQAYYISPDSVLRIWTRRGTSLSQELPAYRFWAHVNYFAQFWEKETEPTYQSPAYVDFGGNGIITTSCTALDRQVGNQSGRKESNSAKAEFLGIFCTDFKLPERKVINNLAGHPFFDLALLTISPKKPWNRTSIEVVFPEKIEESDLRKEAKPTTYDCRKTLFPEICNAVQRAVLDKLNTLQAFSSLRRQVTDIELGSRQSYLLPVGAGDGDSLRTLIVIPKAPEVPLAITVSRFFFLAFIGFTVASVIWGFYLSRRNASLDYRQALLRNLQVGVIQVDSNDIIREANGRAEEILERRLARSDTPDQAIGFESLIWEYVLPEQEDYVVSKVDFIKYADIHEIRKSGEPSSYYARLIELDKWVRVSGTPILFLEHAHKKSEPWSRKLDYSFGVVEEVSKYAVKELEVHWKQWSRRLDKGESQ